MLGPARTLRFLAGPGLRVQVADNPLLGAVDITISRSAGHVPGTAGYFTGGLDTWGGLVQSAVAKLAFPTETCSASAALAVARAGHACVSSDRAGYAACGQADAVNTPIEGIWEQWKLGWGWHEIIPGFPSVWDIWVHWVDCTGTTSAYKDGFLGSVERVSLASETFSLCSSMATLGANRGAVGDRSARGYLLGGWTHDIAVPPFAWEWACIPSMDKLGLATEVVSVLPSDWHGAEMVGLSGGSAIGLLVGGVLDLGETAQTPGPHDPPHLGDVRPSFTYHVEEKRGADEIKQLAYATDALSQVSTGQGSDVSTGAAVEGQGYALHCDPTGHSWGAERYSFATLTRALAGAWTTAGEHRGATTVSDGQDHLYISGSSWSSGQADHEVTRYAVTTETASVAGAAMPDPLRGSGAGLSDTGY